MTEEAARLILLVKAVEEHDSKNELLSPVQRLDASRQSAVSGLTFSSDGRDSPGSAVFLEQRARLLFSLLSRQNPEVELALEATRWRPGLAVLVTIAALAVGLASSALSPSRHISILAFPLLGMLGWNIAVYAVLLISKLRGLTKQSGRASHKPSAPSHTSRASRAAAGGWLVRLATAWISRRARIIAQKPPAQSPQERLQRGIASYFVNWIRQGEFLHLLRAKTVLHVAAAVLAVGAIGGMYLRGLVFEYRATWESTFLNGRQVHRLLQVVLGPASYVTGIPLPAPSRLEQLRGPNSTGENAADWINLYAVTAVLLIVLPRSGLAFQAWRLARWQSQNFPLPLEDAPYFRRLGQAGRRQGAEVVQVVTHSFDLTARQQETLAAFLQEAAGLNARVEFLPTVPYGTEDEFVQNLADRAVARPDILVLVFSLASTPEQEVHGQLMRQCLQASIEGTGVAQVLFLLEESSYRQRLEESGRMEDRRRTWRRQAESCAVPLLLVDLDRPEIDRWLAEIGPQLV